MFDKIYGMLVQESSNGRKCFDKGSGQAMSP